jgi:hypothetical protein
MGVVTTSLVVSLGGDTADNSIYSVEVDSREDGLNAGRTSFNPGDQIYLLLFKTDNVTTLDSIASKGNLTYKGTTKFEVEEYGEFPNEKEVSLSYPVPAGGIVTKKWLGNDLGSTAILNQSILSLTTDDAALGNPYVGVMRYSYTSVADIYLLNNTLIPNQVEYNILCYFAGEAA